MSGHNSKNLEPYKWKAGESGNPHGRPKSKLFRKASPEAMARIVDAYLFGAPDALQTLFNSEDCTPNEKFIISIIQRAASRGDAMALGLILDRFMGKLSDKVEVKNATPSVPGLESLTDEELEKRRELLRSANE